jgi:VCBS repeat-containing protein
MLRQLCAIVHFKNHLLLLPMESVPTSPSCNAPAWQSRLRLLPALALLLLAGLFTAPEAQASHFRYGSITWRHIPGAGGAISRTVEFTISMSWRDNYAGIWTTPQVGSKVTLPSGEGTFQYGDGSTAGIVLTVTARDNVSGWWFGEMKITKTYGVNGSFTARTTSCCRIPPNGSASWNVQTAVHIGQGNSSPVISLPPIVNLEANTQNASFNVPVADPDGQGSLLYRVATAGELGNLAPPAGFSVDPATGVATFDTRGKVAGQLFATGVTVEEVNAQGNVIARVTADFLINIIAKTNNTPPAFDYAVTPADGSSFQARPGQAISFTVRANDAESNVTLNAVGLPSGSSMSPALPATGRPVSSSFTWTPTTANLGTTVINFSIQDVQGLQRTSSVSIKVSLSPEFYGQTPADNSTITVEPGTPVAFPVSIRDADPQDKVRLVQVNGLPLGASVSPGVGGAFSNPALYSFSWTPAAGQSGMQTITFVAEDLNGDRSTRKVNVFVNALPVLATNGELKLIEETTAAIGALLLEATDADHTAAQLTFTIVTLPAEGVLLKNGAPVGFGTTFTQADVNAGLITYKAGHIHGGHTPDSFTFTVADAVGAQIGPFTFNVEIEPSNRPPVGVADAYTTDEDVALTIAAAQGVLANDTDPDHNDVLTALLVSGPAHGTLTLNADGSFGYTPHANYNGADSFSYTVRDAKGATDGPVSVAITVTPVNDAPVVDAGSYGTQECRSPFALAGAASDVDGDALTYAWAVGGKVFTGATPEIDLPVGSYSAVLSVSDGTVTVQASATIDVSDTQKPVITLNGEPTLTYGAATGYADAGANVTDACDGTITPVVTSTYVERRTGKFTITYTATDASGNQSVSERTVNVVDTDAPVLTLKGSPTMTVTCPSCYEEPGATATDAFEPGPTVAISGTVGMVPGTYTVSYTATDASGNVSTARRTVTVVDNTAPVVTGLPAPIQLWSPNHRMERFTLAGLGITASDVGCYAPAQQQNMTQYVRIVRITSDEADNGLGDGDTAGDIVIDGCQSFQVRVERSGKGNGRVYTVMLEVRDGAGNTTPAAFEVHVAKSQGKNGAAIKDADVTTISSTHACAVAAYEAPTATASASAPAEEAAAMTPSIPVAPAPSVAAQEMVPTEYALRGAYPNPFASQATVRFDLPEAARVRIALYDVTGRQVATIADGEMAAGVHRVQLSGGDMAAGVYVIRMTTSTGRAFTQRAVIGR